MPYIPGKQTVEFRVPDGSADLYHLMAGIILAARDGLQSGGSLKRAKDLYVDVNIFKPEHASILKRMKALPTSCVESSEYLERDSDFYTRDHVFPEGTIKNFISKLKSYDDKDLSKRLFKKDEEIKNLVNKYLHCM